MIHRSVLTLLFFLPLTLTATAQIELSYSKAKTIVGATSPEVLPGGRILIEDDSKIAVSSAAVIKTASSDGVRLIAQRGFREFAELILLTTATDGTSKITTTRYLLVGEGKYVIDAISRTNEAWDRSVTITIGVDPKPDPKPIPPDPIPDPPKPIIDVPNDYNVGQIAYKTAPSDAMQAKVIAGWYRVGASKLFGGGGLADIETIKAQINTQFANKQCRDKATCEQWDKWKAAVSAAYVAEQVRRRTFTRQDHYTALVEIATALESVK